VEDEFPRWPRRELRQLASYGTKFSRSEPSSRRELESTTRRRNASQLGADGLCADTREETIDFRKIACTLSFVALQQLALAARGLYFDAEFSRTRRLTLSGAVMSTLIPQQLVNAQSAGVQQVFAFATKAFDGIEKLVALNLQVVKATLAENQDIMTRAVSAKPEELFALSTSLVQPAAEKVASYSRHVYEILSAMQGEIGRAHV
jgi:phasin family protein